MKWLVEEDGGCAACPMEHNGTCIESGETLAQLDLVPPGCSLRKEGIELELLPSPGEPHVF